MNLNLDVTTVFEKTFNAINDENIRFIVEQGGSRSSKTYSICQSLIVYCLANKGVSVSIVRKSFPSLRATVMRDWIEIMKELDLYSERNHNKTEQVYTFYNGSTIDFFSVDDSQKLRGRKRDVLFANEANELNFEEFTQLNMRTTNKLIFDFNPSDNYHWLYDVIDRPNSILIHSTYKDNPFLEKALVKEIEDLINTDESYYKIYALGERATGKTTIYTHQKLIDFIPETKDTIYGLDFGYNNATALVKCDFIDNKVYVKELLYKSHLTATDLINELKLLNISKSHYIIADSARPEIIQDINRAGFAVKPAIKDVKPGIDSVKSTELFITKDSVNIIKEIYNYKWKTNGDLILDDPVKVWDHAMDAMRYGIHWFKETNKRKYNNNYRIVY